MKISGLTIFLISVIIMTTFPFVAETIIIKFNECDMFEMTDEIRERGLSKSDHLKLEYNIDCMETKIFHTTRQRIYQYAIMILICILMVSIKLDKLDNGVKQK